MPISCLHFRDYKALLVTSLTRASSAIASTRPLPLQVSMPSVVTVIDNFDCFRLPATLWPEDSVVYGNAKRHPGNQDFIFTDIFDM